MRFILKSVKERNNVPFFVIFMSMILLGITFLNVPNRVEGEDTEPVLNFYVERELIGHSYDITAIEWSFNGLWIASGSLDNTTKIWSTGTWGNVKTIQHSAPVRGVSWSKNTLKLAISYGNGSIEIWNSISWTLIQNLSEHFDTVQGLDWNPNGTALSSGDSLGNIKIWDTTTWNSIQTLGMSSGVNDLKWNKNGDKLAACSMDGTISVWDTATWTLIESFDATFGDHSIESIAWSPDDSKLASSSQVSDVKIWDTVSWEAIQTLDTETNLRKISWSSDGTYIAVSVMGGIKIWDTSGWDVIKTTELTDNSQVVALAMNPEGDKIASSAPKKTDNTVMIWGKNFSPVLDPIGNQEATEDQPFTFTVSASDDDQLIFSDDSLLFDIDTNSGQISYIPSNDDVGEHVTTLTVSDGKGGIDNETFLFTIINVDDPPVPVLKWCYGADYINITLRVGGQIGNSITLVIEEDETQIDEIIIERESENLDEEGAHIIMNLSRSYEVKLEFSGSSGENPVALTFERGGFAFTKHLIFDSELGINQVINLHMDDFFEAMGLIIFDATESIDVDNEIVKYLWDFGDGNKDEGASLVHSYRDNDKYSVSLTVESDNGINRSVSTEISLNEIPDKEDLESILYSDLTLEYLESTNQQATFIDSRNHLRLVDGRGKTTGYIDNSYKFEIEGVYLFYSYNSYEVYYYPHDLKLTFNIDDTEEVYDLDIIIPNQGSTRIISIYGERGGVALELDKVGTSFIVLTGQMENKYSLKIEADGVLGREVFTLTDINLCSMDKHYYFVNNWEGLTSDDNTVTLGIDDGSDGKIDFLIDLEDGMTGEEIEIIIMNKGKSDPSFFTISNILLIIGFVGIAGIGGLIGSTEVGKLALISLILPLYTRIKKEEVLDNEMRGMIRGYIIANPGDNYNSIKRALGLNNGALAYHLRVLEKANIIQSKQDGMFKRFYPTGMKIPMKNGGEISEMQRILLLEIAESPGISQKEIAKLVGLSKGVINYHVNVLLGKHLLQIEKRGRKTHCYVDKKVLNRIKNKS